MKKKARRRGRIVHNNGTESDLERLFLSEWVSRFPMYRPVTQYMFHKTRQWRLDFSWPLLKVAVEIQGYGTGHTSLIGMTKDYDKHLAATIRGWKMVYLTTIHLSPRKVDDVMFDIATLLGIEVEERPKGYIPLNKRT